MKPKLIRITTVPQSLYSLLKGQLKFMSKSGFDVIGVSSPGEELKQVEVQEGIPTYAVPMTRTIAPFKDLVSLYKLYKIIRKEKPQIVHTHTPKAGTLGMLAAKLAGVPHRLHTIAGLPLLEATGNKRKLLNAVEKTTYACATKIYPNSYGLNEIIHQHKFTTQKKLKVLANGSSNGIDTSYFDPGLFSAEEKQKLRQQLKIDQNELVFVFVGRLVGDKGINELVAAFKALSHSPESPKAKLLLVGAFETALDPLLTETLEEIELNPQILAVGYQKDVRPYFAISDCLVFPSYREGFPNVVMQACAMGLVSIVSDINGCNELIVDGDNGYIVPVKNMEAIKVRMIEIYKAPVKHQKMGAKSRERMQQKYEREFVWNAYLNEYKRLLA